MNTPYAITPVLQYSITSVWSRFCGQILTVCCPEGLSDFVPEGLDDRSQAIIAWNTFNYAARPVGGLPASVPEGLNGGS